MKPKKFLDDIDSRENVNSQRKRDIQVAKEREEWRSLVGRDEGTYLWLAVVFIKSKILFIKDCS